MLDSSLHWLNPNNWATMRWKTAIKRPHLSLPLKNALKSNQLPQSGNWLDFGSGHGLDVTRLPKDYIVKGFDPYYNADFGLIQQTYTIVSCIYVLNVIESQRDRNLTLEFAFSLCTRALIVAVRIDGEGETYTSIGTFQKYYKQSEIIAYVQAHCPGAKLHSLGNGAVIVLKD